MKTYHIKTLEQWTTVVYYVVKAESKPEAKMLVVRHKVDFIDHDHTGDDEILEFTDITEDGDLEEAVGDG